MIGIRVFWKKPTRVSDMNPIVIQNTTRMPIIFGTKVSVISWIEVRA